MGLISKTATMHWSPGNKSSYLSKGYIFTKMKDPFEVKCEDLNVSSRSLVEVKCDCEDCKSPYLKPMQWSSYYKSVKEDGKYYCHGCAHTLFSGESLRRTLLIKSGCISETNPQLIKYFVNKEDAEKYSMFSGAKVDIKCPDCGFIKKNMSISHLSMRGFSCQKCGEKISYPEKIIFNVLDQLGIDFKTQLSKTNFKWCLDYKYDFYIPSLNIILEANGNQHYNRGFNIIKANKKARTLQEEQDNDKIKQSIALENGIRDYIIIDCRKSELEFIKTNIYNSRLDKLFDLSTVVWDKCEEYARSNLIKAACDLWNIKTNNIQEIMDKLKISRSTTKRYLSQGFKLGWCDYNLLKESKKNMIEGHKKCYKKVICLTTGEIFNSSKEACLKYGMITARICDTLKGRSKSAGKSYLGEPLKWMYLKDYEQLKDNITIQEAI